MATAAPLSGAELVLIARVPRAGNRWHQVHFNRAVTDRFFRIDEFEGRTIALERVDVDGKLLSTVERHLVFSRINRNAKIELEFPSGRYPEAGVPLLLAVELDLRRFRYLTLMPGDPGYSQMLQLNQAKPAVGRGYRRVITDLDEVELRWPDCPLRGSPE